MPERRRIVADNSVIWAAYFNDRLKHRGQEFDLTHRSQPLLAAIRAQRVLTFAPDLLLIEFIQVNRERCWGRSAGPRVPDEDANQAIDDFLGRFRTAIVSIPAHTLAATAWELMTKRGIPPADSWYVACAMYNDAELWLSHRHADGLFEGARAVHPSTFVLTERQLS